MSVVIKSTLTNFYVNGMFVTPLGKKTIRVFMDYCNIDRGKVRWVAAIVNKGIPLKNTESYARKKNINSHQVFGLS